MATIYDNEKIDVADLKIVTMPARIHSGSQLQSRTQEKKHNTSVKKYNTSLRDFGPFIAKQVTSMTKALSIKCNMRLKIF